MDCNNRAAVAAKSYVIDYTSALENVIMETETGAGSLTFRYVYGLEKLSVSVSPVTNGAGNLIQNGMVKHLTDGRLRDNLLPLKEMIINA